METSTILIIILLCIGAFQGLAFGIILLKNDSPNKKANRLLAAILFLLSYRLIIQTMRLFGLGYYDTWYYFMIEISWLTPALLYFYVKAQITVEFKFRLKDWFHFIPLFIQVVFSEFVRIQNIYWDGTRESLSWLGYWGYVVWMNYSTIYIVASALIIIYSFKAQFLLRSAEKDLLIDKSRVTWLSRIIMSFKIYFSFVLAILLMDLLFYWINYESSYFYFIRFYYYPFFIGLSGLTYWIGMEGFKRRDEPRVFVKTEISEEERQRLIEIDHNLEKAMKSQELYKDPNLSLNTMAESIKVKPYLLSKCLSEIRQKKFNDYINEIRVEEVQRLIQNPENDKFTLLAIAMEAGFNSKSSFNRAVKKHLGISPNELKDSK